ncbi:uncharacterized protein EV420DRAFT_1473099 [Desarmillaria tabescens]|uniref:Uncharacterized protein n=1 Tax=Armillaria tabescens TaxID=1929756 RepID=A0AA39NQJ7_ARMTA|nr:uncharacterized protein EV420DRAFT_1473099 [Desarmillaria tabescens]KAK0469983.1 hypothetical protein EV420DRAFT_1473099 [Desarmillaria tabescens]
MATILLLAEPDKPVRRKDVGRTVLHCLHGLHSIETALSIFHSFISNSHNHVQPCSDVLASFDPHVGDCACHMRAQMLWDLIEDVSSSPEKKRFLEQAVQLLRESRVKTAILLQNLAKTNGNTGPLGFASIITLSDIFQKIGFRAFMTLVDANSNSSGTNTPAAEAPFVGLGTGSEGNAISGLDAIVDRSFSPVESPSSDTSESSSSSNRSHRSITIDVSWDPTDAWSIVRFLTFSHLLSIPKRVILKPGPPAGMIIRVEPLLSYTETEAGLEALNLVESVSLSSLIRPGDRAKKTALVNECETMQVYISQMSVNWMKKATVALSLSPAAQRLCSNYAVPNTRQVACVSSYLSILPVRVAWLTKGVPILVAIERFCSDGYHIILHRVTRNPDAWDERQSVKDQDITAIGNANWFDVTPVSHDEIISSPWAGQPHIVLIAVSTDGDLEDFYGRLTHDSPSCLGTSQPHNGPCREIENYTNIIEKANFSQLLMLLFGQHEQFPFPLRGQQDGYEYVADCIKSELGEEACGLFMKACSEAYECGTGRSTRMYSFQHVYLELPGVVGRQVKSMLDRKEKPLLGFGRELSR